MDDSVVRESGESCAVRGGMCRMRWLCLRALKCSACAVSRRGSEKYLLPGAREQAVLSQHLGDLSDDGIQMRGAKRYA